MSWRSGVLTGIGCVALVLPAGCGGGDDEQSPPSSSGVVPASSSSSLSPAPRIFDQAALEAGVRRVLTESYQLTGVGTVRCPSGQTVQTGISFDCTVALPEGTKRVTLTVRGSDGTYEVSAPK